MRWQPWDLLLLPDVPCYFEAYQCESLVNANNRQEDKVKDIAEEQICLGHRQFGHDQLMSGYLCHRRSVLPPQQELPRLSRGKPAMLLKATAQWAEPLLCAAYIAALATDIPGLPPLGPCSFNKQIDVGLLPGNGSLWHSSQEVGCSSLDLLALVPISRRARASAQKAATGCCQHIC